MTRKDTLPEDRLYHDTGCSLAPSCLSCPLEHCRYDVRTRRQVSVQRAAAVRRLHDTERMSINEIAGAFGLGRRTVFRYLRATREVRP